MKLLQHPTLAAIVSGERPFWSMVGHASGVFLARFGGAFSNFFFALILARLLPPDEVGFVLLLSSLAMLIALFATMNVENVAVRFLLQPIARGEPGPAAGYVAFVRKICLRMTPVVMIIYGAALIGREYTGSGLGGDSGLVPREFRAILIAALCIPFFTGLRLGNRYGVALDRVMRSAISWGFLRPFFLMLMAAALLLSGTEGRIDLIAGLALIACVLAWGLQQWLLKGMMAPLAHVRPDMSDKKEWLSTGLYLSVTVVFLDFFPNIVLFAASFGLSSGSLGLFAIAVQFIGFLRMGIMAVNTATAPKISKAISTGHETQVRRLLAQTTLLKIGPTVAVTALVWLIAPWLVSLFGSEYGPAAQTLRIIAILPLASAIFGPSVTLLNVVGHQRAVFRLSLISLAILVVAVPVAGRYYGLNGAAGAAVVMMVIWEGLLWLRTRKLTGYDGSILGAIRHWR
ncbi:MAG: MATE family efflux transporter [Parvularculaceae bacterium]